MDAVSVLALVGMLLGGVGVAYTIMRILASRSEEREEYNSAVSRIEEIIAAKSQIVSLADQKKEAMRKMGPKTFYYLDEGQVKDLYPQVFQEPEPKRIQTRETKEGRAGVAAKLHVIEPKYERSKVQEVVRDYDMEQVPAMMYNRVEQFLFDKNRVAFGLEEFEFDRSEIADFEAVCEQMKTKYGYDIPADVRAKFASDNARESALEYTKKLAGTSGYIALQGEFVISDTGSDDCVLSYRHPLNGHLLPEDPHVYIRIHCSGSFLTPSGKATFKPRNAVKIASLGKVVNWNDKDSILKVSPIAIY
jgi:hypothetical protein